MAPSVIRALFQRYTRLSVFGVVFYATLGSLAGALVLYGAGWLLNRERLMKLTAGPVGKALCLKPADVAKAVSGEF